MKDWSFNLIKMRVSADLKLRKYKIFAMWIKLRY